MFTYSVQAVQTHDLLKINPECFLDEATSRGDMVPGWAEEHLRIAPFAVVRRGLISETGLPIGVRGSDRNQRWAASCSPHAVLSAIAPSQLLGRTVVPSRVDAVPALQSLELLQARWIDLDCPWGPGGSVGFELATGMNVAKAESDLDIVIRAARPITIEEANFLCAQATDLPAIVDIRVETPICGFSLKEYARAGRKEILLRMPNGPVLGSDPWRNEPDTLNVANSFERAGL
jgi:phosphoribosyl-dephospho-CoA transferase